MLVVGCPVWKNGVVASRHLLRFVRLMQVPWASFGVVAAAVAATTDRTACAWLGDFAVAATVVNRGDAGGSRRRTAVLARAVGDAMGARGVFVLGCGVGPRVVGSGASRGVKRQWLRQWNWWAALWP